MSGRLALFAVAALLGGDGLTASSVQTLPRSFQSAALVRHYDASVSRVCQAAGRAARLVSAVMVVNDCDTGVIYYRVPPGEPSIDRYLGLVLQPSGPHGGAAIHVRTWGVEWSAREFGKVLSIEPSPHTLYERTFFNALDQTMSSTDSSVEPTAAQPTAVAAETAAAGRRERPSKKQTRLDVAFLTGFSSLERPNESTIRRGGIPTAFPDASQAELWNAAVLVAMQQGIVVPVKTGEEAAVGLVMTQRPFALLADRGSPVKLYIYWLDELHTLANNAKKTERVLSEEEKKSRAKAFADLTHTQLHSSSKWPFLKGSTEGAP